MVHAKQNTSQSAIDILARSRSFFTRLHAYTRLGVALFCCACHQLCYLQNSDIRKCFYVDPFVPVFVLTFNISYHYMHIYGNVKKFHGNIFYISDMSILRSLSDTIRIECGMRINIVRSFELLAQKRAPQQWSQTIEYILPFLVQFMHIFCTILSSCYEPHKKQTRNCIFYEYVHT